MGRVEDVQREMRDAGVWVFSGGLEAPSTSTVLTAPRDGGEVLVTDGPFVELKEAIGGWFLLEADDLDAAIAVAAQVPAARHGGGVEVRPVAEW